MLLRANADPSPFRSGLLHGVLSLLVFGGFAGLIGGIVHLTGDPDEAGPQHIVALFATETDEVPGLRIRTASQQSPQIVLAANDTAEVYEQTSEPNLGVSDPGSTGQALAQQATSSQAGASTQAAAPRGIRINGKLVSPGQRLSQFEEGAGPSPAVQINSATPAAGPAPVEPPRNPKARPFENPEGKPIVSLVIGGLGTSHRQAIAAIDELPAEVTLSFVPTANANLLGYARQKGHEVLLELPMESYGQGTGRPHRDTLLAEASAEQNLLRLNSLLRGRDEIYGVITDKGDKFITSDTVGSVILEELDDKGLAFFTHGTLGRNTFKGDAANLNMEFAAADENIDTEIRASAIEAQLFKLETEASENGMAFGTGFSYPLTVDTVSRWSRRLEAKGILLAPASAVAAETKKARSFKTSQLQVPAGGADAQP